MTTPSPAKTRPSSARSREPRLDRVIDVLDQMERLHGELHDTLADKLQRMKRAEVDEMNTCIQREQTLVRAIHQQEQRRRRMVEQLGRGFGMSDGVARTLSIRALAERLADRDAAGRMVAAAERLKSVVCRIERTNALIQRVSEEVLEHMRCVFEAMTQDRDAEDAAGYSQDPSGGRRVNVRGRRGGQLFEAVG